VGQKAVVPLDRYEHVDEVEALVAFVAGPESSYINDANLTFDAGTSARRNAGERDSRGHAD
jgi:3-oxoacyl-[acyl-carrier protein] reductase